MPPTTRARRGTTADRLVEFLRAHPNDWFTIGELAEAVGAHHTTMCPTAVSLTNAGLIGAVDQPSLRGRARRLYKWGAVDGRAATVHERVLALLASDGTVTARQLREFPGGTAATCVRRGVLVRVARGLYKAGPRA